MNPADETQQFLDAVLAYVEQTLGPDARLRFEALATELAPDEFALEVSCTLSCAGVFPAGDLGLALSTAAAATP